MADSIKVVVKVRPVSRREADEGLAALWECDSAAIWVRGGGCGGGASERYSFDAVLDAGAPPRALYDQLAAPVVAAALQGINGTIFAYGQTSSGKTYTMMGTKDSEGIIPMAIDHVFKLIEDKKDRDFLLRVSYIEIYNDRIRDLIDVNNTDLKTHEDYNGQVSVNSKEVITTTSESILNVMSKGNHNRSVGGTLMNDVSSRSHAIFQIIIESRKHAIPGSEDDESVNVSQLNFVDLAGSERASSTGDNKGRLREGGHINKSLTTLSLVIRQLSEAQGDPNRYISYRDSKLTRILQSSLGGNAKTGIICTVTPAVLEETHSTLKFAMCAKVVKNKPVVNAVMSDATQLKILTKQIKSLQKDIESKKNLEEHNLELQEKILKLKEQIMMGICDPEVKQRNATLRRRTWCGPNLLSIPENDDFQNIAPLRKFFYPSISNATDISDSSNSPPSALLCNELPPQEIYNVQSDSDDLIYIGDSDDETRCSPIHKCYDVQKTPPCVLRGRTKFAEKEFKELQEMTKLEQLFVPKELEFIQKSKILSEEFIIAKEELTTIKSKYENIEKSKLQLMKEIDTLKLANTDLEFKLETSLINHKRREEDLILCLNEARKNSAKSGYVQPVSSDSSMEIPIIETNFRINISTQVEKSDIIDHSDKFIQTDIELPSDSECPVIDTSSVINISTQVEKSDIVVYSDAFIQTDIENTTEIESLYFELKEKIEMNECLEILLAEKNCIVEQLLNENSRLVLEIEHLNCTTLIPDVPQMDAFELKNNSVKDISDTHPMEINSSKNNTKTDELFETEDIIDKKLNEYSNNLEIVTKIVEDSNDIQDKCIDEINLPAPLNISKDDDKIITDNDQTHISNENVSLCNDASNIGDELNSICGVLKKLILQYGKEDKEIDIDLIESHENEVAKSKFIFNKILEIEKILEKEVQLGTNGNIDKIKVTNQFNTELNDSVSYYIKNNSENKSQNDLLKSKISTPKFKTNNLQQSFKEINKENIFFPNCDILDITDLTSPSRQNILKCKSNNNTPHTNDNSIIFGHSKNNISKKADMTFPLQKSGNQSHIACDTSLDSELKLNIEKKKPTNISCEKCGTVNRECLVMIGNIKDEINAINNSKEIEALYNTHQLKNEFIMFFTLINNIVAPIQKFHTEFLISNTESNRSFFENLGPEPIPIIKFGKHDCSDVLNNGKLCKSEEFTDFQSISKSEITDSTYDSNYADIFVLLSEFNDTIVNFESYLQHKDMDIKDIVFDKKVEIDNNEKKMYLVINDLHTKIKNIFKNHKALASKNNLSLSKTLGYLNNASVITDEDEFIAANFLNKVNDLTNDSEELQKQLLHQQNKQHADNAELRSLSLKLVATEHYHNSIHNTCQSTIKYLKENLITLQYYLQNLTDEQNVCKSDFNNSSTFVNSYANNSIDESSYFENSTINNDKNDCSVDYKILYDNTLAECQLKNEENSVLTEKLKKMEEFECKVKVLECENESLSSEIMEYIQEIESLQTQVCTLSKDKNDVTLNTSITSANVLQKILTGKSDAVSDNSNSIVCHITFENVNLISPQLTIDNFIKEISGLKANLEQFITLFHGAKDNIYIENDSDSMEKHAISIPLAVQLICSQDTEFMSEFRRKMDNLLEPKFIKLYKLCHESIKINTPYLCEICEKNIQLLFESPDTFHSYIKSEYVPSTEIINDAHINKIQMLEAEVENKEKRIEDLKSEMSKITLNLEKEMSDFNEVLLTTTDKLNNAIGRENLLKDEIEELKNIYADMVLEIKSKSAVEKELSENLRMIKLENVELNEKLTLLNIKIQEAFSSNSADVNNYNEDIKKYQSEISEYENRENNMRKQIDGDKIIMATLNSEINSLQSINEKLIQKMNIEDEDLKMTNEKYQSILKKFKEQEEEHKNSEQHYHTLSLENNSLRSEIEQYKDDINKLSLEFDQTKIEINRNKIEIASKEEEINSLLAKLEMEKDLFDKCKAEIKSVISLKEIEIVDITDTYENNISMLNEKHSKLIKELSNLWKSIDTKNSIDESFESKDIINLIKCGIIDNQKKMDIKSQNIKDIYSQLEQATSVNTSLKTQIIELNEKILNIGKEYEHILADNNNKICVILYDLLKNISANALAIDNLSDFDHMVKEIEGAFYCKEKYIQTKENEISELVLKLENEINGNKKLKEHFAEIEVIKKDEISKLSSKLECEINTNHRLNEQLIRIEAELCASKDMNATLNTQINKLFNTVCGDIKDLEPTSNMEQILYHYNRIILENNQLDTSVKNYELHSKQLENELNECKMACELMHKEKSNFVKEMECKDQECKKYLSNIANLEVQIKEINATKTSEKSSGSHLEPGGGLMDFFVDKMTHDLVQDKNKQLQKANEDLRSKNKELIIELRRLQHSLQNSTLNSLLPQDKANITQLKETIKRLEIEGSHMKELQSNYDALAAKHKDLDEEYETFFKIFKEKEEGCRQLYGEKKLLENRVASLEMEISEMKIDNQNIERRKKRQSLHDMSRGCLPTGDSTVNDILDKSTNEHFGNSRITELERKFAELVNSNNELRNIASRLKNTANNSKKEATKETVATHQPSEYSNTTSGSAIIREQQLREYMAENLRLTTINGKLKEVCRMRDKKIKELERSVNP